VEGDVAVSLGQLALRSMTSCRGPVCHSHTCPSLLQARKVASPASVNTAMDAFPRPSGSTFHRQGNHCPGTPVGEGEPDLGLSSHSRRTAHHGNRHRRLEHLGDPQAPAIKPPPRRSAQTWAEFLAAQTK
jgi:hypothetical protein